MNKTMRQRFRRWHCPDHLTQQELASLLGVSLSWMKRHRRTGVVPEPAMRHPDDDTGFWSPDQVQKLLDMRSRKA